MKINPLVIATFRLLLIVKQNDKDELTDGFPPHFPLPAALAASSSSTRRATSGARPSLRTVASPSDTSVSVIFSPD